MRLFKTTLITTCAAVASAFLLSIAAVPAFADGLDGIAPSQGKRFMTGVLVQTVRGKKQMLVGNILARHEWITESFSKKKEPVVKVLWAGEIETTDGEVSRINETAGIIRDRKDLAGDINYPGAGMKNLKLFLEENPEIKEKYFKRTPADGYIKYDPQDEHLDSRLKDVARARHDTKSSLSGVVTYISIIEDSPQKEGKFYTSVISSTENILASYERAIQIAPELDMRSWKVIKAYLEKILSDDIDFSHDVFYQAYQDFNMEVGTYLIYVSQNYSVLIEDTLSDYLGKSYFSPQDLVELLDKRKLVSFIAQANTVEEIEKLRVLLEKLVFSGLSPERIKIVGECYSVLHVAGKRINELESNKMKWADAQALLCAHLKMPLDSPVELVATEALDSFIEDLEAHEGVFSANVLRLVAREDVLDFMSANSGLEEVAKVSSMLKTVLKIENSKFDAEYYKRPEFEEVRRNLKELRGIIKK